MSVIEIKEAVTELNPRSEDGQPIVVNASDAPTRTIDSIRICCQKAFLSEEGYRKHKEESPNCLNSPTIVSIHKGNKSGNTNEGEVRQTNNDLNQNNEEFDEEEEEEDEDDGFCPIIKSVESRYVPPPAQEEIENQLDDDESEGDDENGEYFSRTPAVAAAVSDALRRMNMLQGGEEIESQNTLFRQRRAVRVNRDPEVVRRLNEGISSSEEDETGKEDPDSIEARVESDIEINYDDDDGDEYEDLHEEDDKEDEQQEKSQDISPSFSNYIKNGKTIYNCNVKYCRRTTNNFHLMEIHMKNAHNLKKFSCSKCPSTFGTKPLLDRHLTLNHTNLEHFNSQIKKVGNFFECPLCSYQGARHNSTLFHMAKAHQNGKFPCKFCVCRYSTKSSLHKHLTTLHSEEPKNLLDFEKPTKSRNIIKQEHIEIVPRIITEILPNRKHFRCSGCNHLMGSRQEADRHLRHSHVQNTIFRCQICPCGFATDRQLRHHTTRHSTRKTKISLQKSNEQTPKKVEIVVNNQVNFKSPNENVRESSWSRASSPLKAKPQEMKSPSKNVTEKINLTPNKDESSKISMHAGKLPSLISINNKFKCQANNGIISYFCKAKGCVFVTQTSTQIKYHVLTAHDEFRQISCTFCTCKFTKKAYLIKHEQEYHSTSSKVKKITSENTTESSTRKSDSNRNINRCIISGCVYQTFQSSTNMENHLKVAHSPNGNFRCPHCPCRYKFSIGLTKHVKLAHKERDSKKDDKDAKNLDVALSSGQTNKKRHRNKKYKCSKCNYLGGKADSIRHELNAHSVGKFKCSKCSCRFITYQRLQAHSYSHTRTAKMTVAAQVERQSRQPDVSKNGATSYVQTNPMKSSDEILHCKKCNFETKWENLLDYHYKTSHVKDGIWNCKWCDCLFQSELYLVMHHASEHPGKSTTGSAKVNWAQKKTGINKKGVKVADENGDILSAEESDEDEPKAKESDEDDESKAEESDETEPKTKVKKDETPRNLKRFKCPKCPVKFQAKYMLKKHLKSNHFKGGVKCNLCSCKFINLRNLSVHKSWHNRKDLLASNKIQINVTKQTDDDGRNENSTTYRCSKCSFKTMLRISLKMHEKKCKNLVASSSPKAVEPSPEKVNLTTPRIEGFQCMICSNVLATKFSLEKHKIKSHFDGDGNYRCILCTCQFEHFVGLRTHLAIRHSNYKTKLIRTQMIMKEKWRVESRKMITNKAKQPLQSIVKGSKKKIFRCEKCPFTSITFGVLNMHTITSHVKSGEFSCVECRCCFASEKGLRAHKNSTHAQRRKRKVQKRFAPKKMSSTPQAVFIKCPKCFLSISNFHRHSTIAHVENGKRCTDCSCSFATAKGLNYHQTRVHGKRKESSVVKNAETKKVVDNTPSKKKVLLATPNKSATFNCPKCPFRTPNNIIFLRHQKKAHRESGYGCDHCSCCYITLAALSNHIRICHDPKKPKEVKESIKADELPVEPSKQQTFEKLSAIGKFQCSHCNYFSHNKANLAIHMRTSHVLNGFSCDKCNCSFATEKGRTIHKLKPHSFSSDKATEEKETKAELLACSICDYTSISQETVTKHEKTCHVVDGLFSCNECTYSFANQFGLTVHKAKPNAHVNNRRKEIPKKVDLIEPTIKAAVEKKNDTDLLTNEDAQGNSSKATTKNVKQQTLSKKRTLPTKKITVNDSEQCFNCFDYFSFNDLKKHLHSCKPNEEYDPKNSSYLTKRTSALLNKRKIQEPLNFIRRGVKLIKRKKLSAYANEDEENKKQENNFQNESNKEDKAPPPAAVELVRVEVESKEKETPKSVSAFKRLSPKCRPIKCNQCGKVCIGPDNLKFHVDKFHNGTASPNTENDKKILHKCLECACIYRTKEELSNHIKLKHFENEKIILKVTSSVESQEAVQDVSSTTTTLEINERPQENETDRSDYETCPSADQDGISSISSYRCKICLYSTEYLANIQSHLKTSHFSNGFFECENCTCNFEKKINLIYHTSYFHPSTTEEMKDTNKEDETSKVLSFKGSVSTCSSFDGSGTSKTDKHVERKIHSCGAAFAINSDTKLSVNCPECKMKFKKGHLTRHMTICHSQLRNAISCVDCKCKFASKYAHQKHIAWSHKNKIQRKGDVEENSESIESLQKCETCGQEFVIPGSHESHYEACHSSKASILCVVCSCKFENLKTLDDHMVGAHGLKKEKLQQPIIESDNLASTSTRLISSSSENNMQTSVEIKEGQKILTTEREIPQFLPPNLTQVTETPHRRYNTRNVRDRSRSGSGYQASPGSSASSRSTSVESEAYSPTKREVPRTMPTKRGRGRPSKNFSKSSESTSTESEAYFPIPRNKGRGRPRKNSENFPSSTKPSRKNQSPGNPPPFVNKLNPSPPRHRAAFDFVYNILAESAESGCSLQNSNNNAVAEEETPRARPLRKSALNAMNLINQVISQEIIDKRARSIPTEDSNVLQAKEESVEIELPTQDNDEVSFVYKSVILKRKREDSPKAGSSIESKLPRRSNWLKEFMKYVCSRCGEPFDSNISLTSHFQGCNRACSSFECGLCSDKYPTLVKLKEHIWKVHKPEDYQEILDPIAIRHPAEGESSTSLPAKASSPYTCSLCKMGLNDRKSYIFHISVPHLFRCKRCSDYVCNTKEAMEAHKNLIHRSRESKDKPKTSGSSAAKEPSTDRKSHSNKHYKCKCGSKFRKRTEFKDHFMKCQRSKTKTSLSEIQIVFEQSSPSKEEHQTNVKTNPGPLSSKKRGSQGTNSTETDGVPTESYQGEVEPTPPPTLDELILVDDGPGESLICDHCGYVGSSLGDSRDHNRLLLDYDSSDCLVCPLCGLIFTSSCDMFLHTKNVHEENVKSLPGTPEKILGATINASAIDKTSKETLELNSEPIQIEFEFQDFQEEGYPSPRWSTLTVPSESSVEIQEYQSVVRVDAKHVSTLGDDVILFDMPEIPTKVRENEAGPSA